MSRVLLQKAQSFVDRFELCNKVLGLAERIVLLLCLKGVLEFEGQLFVLVLIRTQVDADQLPCFCLCDAALD